MSEFSRLNGYDVKDKKAIRHYNTLTDLKADESLQTGEIVKIMGYSVLNDGGNMPFIIREKTVTDTDGEKGIFILNNNLVAEKVINTNALELNPSINNNEVISNLTIENNSTSSASAGIVLSEHENVTVVNNDITGGYWSAKIGNENDIEDTTGIKLIGNKLTSNHGLSLRQRTGSTDGGEHTLILNKILNLVSNPGVESWAKDVQVLFNRIKNISGSVGGTGGITLGSKPNQMAIGNFIDNYNYGIEVGNSNLNIISNNIIRNCTKGIVCSSDNTHEVIISNSIIQVPQNGDGIYLRSGERVTIDNCIIIYGNTLGDYNDSTSRSGKGISSDTYDKYLNITNCTFINLASANIPANTHLSNCTFINMNNVYFSKNAYIDNCTFKDVNTISITGAVGFKQIFNNCTFIRSNDNTTMNQYMINGRAGANIGIAEFNNCINVNCEIDSMKSDSVMGGNKRFLAQKINGIYHTYNLSQLSVLKSNFENMGYTLYPGDKIIDNYNNKVWEVMTQDRQISYQNAIPNTGAFVKGDKIYNNLQTTVTVEYWLCTSTGEFGTDTEPVFVAHNI